MFKDRRLVIATKHQKEIVIAPLIEHAIGVKCFTNEVFDTDTLGTFSGEVERKNDPLTTVREKCLMAMKLSNCDLGIANEGSFGAHPAIPFGSADEELVIFIDLKNKLEIVAKTLSVHTNFNGKYIVNQQQLLEFARDSHFPSHALILRSSKDNCNNIIKGITDETLLLEGFRNIYDEHGKVFIETDMRAMCNPTRMTVIEDATKRLVEKLNSYCPKCNIPGFDISTANQGLPCGLCGAPTASILSHIYECKHCKFSSEVLHPHNKTEEDPMYCDFCNP